MTTVNGVYTPRSTPKPHPRVKPEAAEYAERNKGSVEKWFDYSQNKSYDSPRPVERLPTDDARRNANTNKGCMNELLGGYADPPVERKLHPRAVKGEASQQAEAARGGAMKNLIDNYGQLGLEEKPVPKIKGDIAEEIEQKYHGKMDTLINHYGQLTPEAPPQPKVSYGGEEVAEKYKGAGMGPLLRMEEKESPQEPKISKLHQKSEGPGWDENPPAVRMRPEAEGIAEKNSETQADRVMRGEVAPPTVRTPRLPKHMEESETPRPVTSPQRTRPEAMHNYMKNNSSDMMSLLRGDNSAPTHTPKKMNRNLQRSELW